jgi:hypothetical protein
MTGFSINQGVNVQEGQLKQYISQVIDDDVLFLGSLGESL